MTFHVEAAAAPVRLARELRAQGARAGMALKPATPIEPYEDLLPELDMLLVMTVEPGFGGQKFLDLCLPKIRRTRELIDKHGLDLWLQVDGGVSLETIERCAEAGADVFVAGSAVFGADDPDAMVERCARPPRPRSLNARPGAHPPCPRNVRGVPWVTGTCRSSGRAGVRRSRPGAGRCGRLASRVNSSRALGSVQFRAGGDSPRPGCSQRPVDQVELLDRR